MELNRNGDRAEGGRVHVLRSVGGLAAVPFGVERQYWETATLFTTQVSSPDDANEPRYDTDS
jgi:hypothetical protein